MERQGKLSGAFLFVLAKKKCPRTPKEKSAFAGAVEPYAGGVGEVVIPKQDTFLCIADRSLSRLRGSPLTGAGCLGPLSCVGAFILPSIAAAAMPPVRSWVAVPFGF